MNANDKVVFHEKTGELGIHKYVGLEDKSWGGNHAVYLLDPVTLQETGERKHTTPHPWRELPMTDPRVLFITLFNIFEGGFADWHVTHTEENCETDELYIRNRAEVFEIFRDKILKESVRTIVKQLQTATKQLQIDGESILDLEATVKKLEEKLTDAVNEPNKDVLLLNLGYIEGFAKKMPEGMAAEAMRWCIYAVQQYVEKNEIPSMSIDPETVKWTEFKDSFQPAIDPPTT